jgi:phage FluMu gp28-like protein
VGPWNVYFKITMTDAIESGFVELMNRARGTHFDRQTFLADCRARSRDEDIFEQSYMCNPRGAAANHIVEWSAIERCRFDYEIIRVHLEHAQIIAQFGNFSPPTQAGREDNIDRFIHSSFLPLFQTKSVYRLGFDVAASGQGDLPVIYVDEVKGEDLWLRGLFTCRTDDWNFLKTVLFYFLKMLRRVSAAGDETGLGRQICWEASQYFRSVFTSINFSGKKPDIGFNLMNQLATSRKRFPSGHQDIAADFFALRKMHDGSRWIFTEGRNTNDPASHCDIAWAGGLASEAHATRKFYAGDCVCWWIIKKSA